MSIIKIFGALFTLLLVSCTSIKPAIPTLEGATSPKGVATDRRCTSPQTPDLLGRHNIVDYGATPSYGDDPFDPNDSYAIQQAINCAGVNGSVYIPPGLFHINRPLLIEGTPVNIVGSGTSSGIFQLDRRYSLLRLVNVAGPQISDLFLGAYTDGGSLVEMKLTRYARLDNLRMIGGTTGIKLEGALSNSFYDLKSGANIPEPFKACPTDPNRPTDPPRCETRWWVDITSGIHPTEGLYSPNANVFYNPQFEGGKNGFRMINSKAGGGLMIYGGVISAQGSKYHAGRAIDIVANAHPILISGMHIEGSEVRLARTQNVTIQSTLILPDSSGRGGVINIEGGDQEGDPAIYTKQTLISNSKVDRIRLTNNVTMTRLEHVALGLSGICSTVEQCVWDNSASPSDTQYFNVTMNGAQSRGAGTIGLGVRNPDFLTTNSRLDINGGQRDNVSDPFPKNQKTIWTYQSPDLFGPDFGPVTIQVSRRLEKDFTSGGNALWYWGHKDDLNVTYDGGSESKQIKTTYHVGTVCVPEDREVSDGALMVIPLEYRFGPNSFIKAKVSRLHNSIYTPEKIITLNLVSNEVISYPCEVDP